MGIENPAAPKQTARGSTGTGCQQVDGSELVPSLALFKHIYTANALGLPNRTWVCFRYVLPELPGRWHLRNSPVRTCKPAATPATPIPIPSYPIPIHYYPNPNPLPSHYHPTTIPSLSVFGPPRIRTTYVPGRSTLALTFRAAGEVKQEQAQNLLCWGL